MNLDDFKLYLPKFLSAESDKELFDNLKSFPDSIDARMYTNYLAGSDIIYQGDGIKDMLYINLPNPEVRPVKSIILSNTCDIDTANKRNFPSQIVYSPIFSLERYREALVSKSQKTPEQIDAHIASIKRQEITQVFFLPAVNDILEDSIVFFDRVCNFPNKSLDRSNLEEKRIFTLSDYGAYMFLFKLSIHFTRIQDQVERKSITI